MKEINIARTIWQKRREKKITQEELASHIGVTKASISKWESGQSYPDITLLPVLASYFDISIDELVDYQPQMSREELRKTYLRLSDAFAESGWDAVYPECREIVHKYYSCFPLLLQMGILYINHMELITDSTKRERLTEECGQLFLRVENACEEPDLVKQARCMRAFLFLMSGKPEEVIDLLEGETVPTDGSAELLAGAYQQRGQPDQARAVLQSRIYASLVAVLGAGCQLLGLYMGDNEKLDGWMKEFQEFIHAFALEQLHPAAVLNIYLQAAYLYQQCGETDQALDYLEAYVQTACEEGFDDPKLKGDGLFDHLEGYLDTFVLGSSAPRNASLISRSIRDAVLQNPAFTALESSERFRRLKHRLELLAESSR